MVDKKGNVGLNYNYQTVTDNKYGFRLVRYITTNPNNQKELKRLVGMTTERICADNFIICIYNGYSSPDPLKQVSKTNTKVVMLDDVDASRKKYKIKINP